MKKFFGKILQSGLTAFIIGIGLIAGVAFAATWVYNPQTASNGDPLTVGSWNEMVNAIEELQIQADAASESGSVGGYQMVLPGETFPDDVTRCEQKLGAGNTVIYYNDGGTWKFQRTVDAVFTADSVVGTGTICPDSAITIYSGYSSATQVYLGVCHCQ